MSHCSDDRLKMFYLHQFEIPGWMVNQTFQLNLVGNCSLQFHVSITIQLQSWKQVIDQAEEQGLIFINLRWHRKNVFLQLTWKLMAGGHSTYPVKPQDPFITPLAKLMCSSTFSPRPPLDPHHLQLCTQSSLIFNVFFNRLPQSLISLLYHDALLPTEKQMN